MFWQQVFLLILSVFTLASDDKSSPADPDPNRFAAEIAAFKDWDSKNAVPAESVLFVGSSSIRLWHTRELFQDDKLHLNTRGYKVWTRALVPVVRKVLDLPAAKPEV